MVRKARMSDLPQLLSVYARAREFMKETGNPDQWRDNYPPRETVVDDIEKEQLYVVFDGDTLLGVFMFRYLLLFSFSWGLRNSLFCNTRHSAPTGSSDCGL